MTLRLPHGSMFYPWVSVLVLVVFAFAAPVVAQPSIEVTADGVGIGTDTPESDLHIVSSDPTNQLVLKLERAGPLRMWLSNTNATGITWSYLQRDTGDFSIIRNETNYTDFRINPNGDIFTVGSFTVGNPGLPPPDNAPRDITATGDIIAGGDIFSTTCALPGSPCAPDYVFETGYDLMSLEDLSVHVAKHKSLPGVPSASDLVGPINVSKLQMKLLEKLEELTLYTIELHEQNLKQQEKLDELSALLEAKTLQVSSSGGRP